MTQPPLIQPPHQARSSNFYRIRIVVDLVNTGDLPDVRARRLPRTLNDPGKRAVQASGFVLDFLKHGFREIQALLSFVASAARVLVIRHEFSPLLFGSGWGNGLGLGTRLESLTR